MRARSSTPFRRSWSGSLLLGIIAVIAVSLTSDPAAWAQSGKEKPATGAQPLSILSVTPTGDDVPATKKLVIQFSRPVVPLGRMERAPEEVPVTIEPALPCQWRWLDRTNLGCILDNDDAMKKATRYRLRVVPGPGVTTEDGVTIPEPYLHEFLTIRPSVDNHWFTEWLAPGHPVVRLNFDQDVLPETVAAHVYYKHGETRVPVDAALPKENTAEGEVIHIEDPTKDLPVAADVTVPGRNYGSRAWNVSPKTELPLDTDIELVIEPGVKGAAGPELGAENRTIVGFKTFPELKFLGVRCEDNRYSEVFFPADGSGANGGRCNPLRAVYLVFSSPVLKEEVKPFLKATPDLAGGRTDYDPWEEVYTYSRRQSPPNEEADFRVPLPFGLKAYETYHLRAEQGSIKDEFGRAIPQPLAISFDTDHRLPRFTNANGFSVLERDVDSHLPLFVTNLKSVQLSYDILTTVGHVSQQTHTITLPAVEDISWAIPIKTRELIGASTGVMSGHIDTDPPTDNSEYERFFFSQVTPFHVHAKLGHYNTLVWVTDFTTGQPVSGAKVEIGKGTLRGLRPLEVLSHGTTGEDGGALVDGTRVLDPELDLVESWRTDQPRLIVQVTKGDNIAWLPLIYNFRVSPRGPNDTWIQSSLRKRYGHVKAWGTTAQGVYKLGDTIQYKFYVRDTDGTRLIPAEREGYSLEVIDPMDKVVHEEKELTLSEFGAHEGEFPTLQNGAMGWYRFVLSRKGTDYTWTPLQVLVTDFTPAPFRVTPEIKGARFGEEDEVPFEAHARLHSGGPYANGELRITGRVVSKPIPVKDTKLAGFDFSRTSLSEPITVHSAESRLDQQGDFTGSFKLAKPAVYFGSVIVETAVKDERGKFVAGEASADYFSRDRFVGLKSTDWLLDTGKDATIQTAVVDEQGAATSGAAVTVDIIRTEVKASRVKGAGNAYLTNYEDVTVPVASCKLTSGTEPVPCGFRPDKPGTYTITASVTDTKGRTHTTSMTKWASGRGDVLWRRDEGNLLNIIPEKTSYKVGETARFMVQNPFASAKALVTVERYGTIKRWIETFDEPAEVVELPIAADDIPGVFVSITAMSPRVDKPVDENQVDLGRPAFAMGYVQLEVRDPAKEILVDVRPEREVYKPRETVSVSFQARTQKGEHPPMELAVAVLDESVFDLIQGGPSYFDPYKGLNSLDSLDLANFNDLMQLVGRRKFELKGGNPGGGGGFDKEPRSLFKFVSYWNPSIKLDREGRANIEFQLPDNLTGWRVLAMAVTAEDQMGLGQGTFKENQPTEIRPALPNQVVEGDRFTARFTVMNRTDKPRTLRVEAKASGPALGASTPLETSVEVAPFERKELSFPVETRIAGDLTFDFKAGDAADGDALRLPFHVKKRMALESVADYGSLADGGTATQSIRFPSDIRTDVGVLEVLLSSTVVAGLEGAFAYMRDYPYLCWEQILSKGVMAAQYRNLRRYLKPDFEWLNSDSLPQATLAMAAGFQAPNGGMTFFIPADEYVSPYLSAYTAIAFNWMRTLGYEPPASVEERLHKYLLGLLGETEMPTFYSKGMASTTRAVALAALAERGKVGRDEVVRHMPHIKEMDLFGAAHLLQALTRFSDTEYQQQAVVERIRAHADQSAGKFVFSEEIDFAFQRILSSRLRTNCAILSALVQYEERHPGGTALSDVPYKLVRSITQTRKHRGHWENTQENMFCMAAISAYSGRYEKADPDFSVKVDVDGALLGEERFKGVKETPSVLSRPIAENDPGRAASVTISQAGTGRLYHSTRLSFSPKVPRTTSTNAGIEVKREYAVERDGTWKLVGKDEKVRVGDIVRVDLYVSIPAQRNFVVVADPVPGGLEPVNRDLATASKVDADKAGGQYSGGSIWFDYRDWHEYGVELWSFYHRELRHDEARFYSEFLPAGNYHLSYVAQAIAPGSFTVLPTHAEEMYDPDVFGQSGAFELPVEPVASR